MTTKRRSPKSDGICEWRCMSMASRLSGVICRMPEGCRISFFFCSCDTSPCQCQTSTPHSRQMSLSRTNWSLMRAFSGAIYRQPMEVGGCSCNSVMIGKKAASVLPAAVEAESRTLASVLKMASPAAAWMARSACQPSS